MEAIKITNPNWLPSIAPRIAEYAKILDIPGMTYEQLYSYFVQAIQFANGASEFWVIFDDENNPIAFGHWLVRNLPFAGKAYFDHLYKWSKSKVPIHLLIEKFKDFFLKMRCTMADAAPVNEKLASVFEDYAKEAGWLVEKTNQVYLIMNYYPEKKDKINE